MTSRALSIIEHTSPNAVRTYFSTFTGRYFERIGGGVSPENRDVVTADDLVAVQMLSVTIPPTVAAELLIGDLGTRLTGLLADVPTDVELGDPGSTEHIVPGSAAVHAWDLLLAEPGMGRTKTSKLLARKRPRLLPVIDDVTRCALGHPARYWESMLEDLGDPALRRSLRTLRGAAGTDGEVTDLRILDIAIWLSHAEDHREGRCGALVNQ